MKTTFFAPFTSFTIVTVTRKEGRSSAWYYSSACSIIKVEHHYKLFPTSKGGNTHLVKNWKTLHLRWLCFKRILSKYLIFMIYKQIGLITGTTYFKVYRCDFIKCVFSILLWKWYSFYCLGFNTLFCPFLLLSSSMILFSVRSLHCSWN